LRLPIRRVECAQITVAAMHWHRPPSFPAVRDQGRYIPFSFEKARYEVRIISEALQCISFLRMYQRNLNLSILLAIKEFLKWSIH
jgi:hypothetical protein